MKSLVKVALRQLGYEIRRAGRLRPVEIPVPPPAPVAIEPPAPPPPPPPPAAPPAPPVPDAFSEQARLFQNDPPGVVFDVGAHHGQTARTYRALFPGAAIHCFEPFPESFTALGATAAELTGVRTHNVALSDAVGEAAFHSNAFSPTNSLLPTDPAAGSVWGEGLVDTVTEVRVRTTTLDEFCRTHAIEAIDLLKLDVQGAEPQVLAGAAGMLRAGRVRVVYTEIITLPTYAGQIELDEFLRLMRGYGFELFNLFNLSVTATGQLRQVDAIFLRTGERKPG